MPDTTTTTTVKLKNTAAHLKHISLGTEVISIPPTESGDGTTIKLESDAERAAFTKAIATPSVKAWIDEGELVITGAPASVSQPVTPPITPPADTSNPAAPPLAEPPAAAAETTTQRVAIEPAQTTRRASGRDHDK